MIKQNILAAAKRADKEINNLARDGGRYASGTAAEGYMGGYRDALNDVLLVLNGVKPQRLVWHDWLPPKRKRKS